MIKLFNSTDKLFSSNGDKTIIPTKAKIHKEDNGAYYLDLETGIEYVNDLIQGNIIVAPTPQGEQAFRLSNPEKTKSKIKVRANHLFYDSKNYLIADSYVVNKNCDNALKHLNAATDNPSPFTTLSNIQSINSYRCVRKSLYEAIQTVIERWGGHLVRENWTIKVMSSIGQDNGVTVRYAKNLKDITCTENWDNVVTKLMPVGKDGLLLPERYVYSDIQYTIPYTKTVSFNQDINEDNYKDNQGNLDEDAYKEALIEDLRQQATVYVSNNSIPQVNYTLKANVEKITDIGDTIQVIDERFGIDILTHLISYDYDCILGKYTELEFGNFTQKLSDLIGTITNNTNNAITSASNELILTINTELQEILSTLWNTLESKIKTEQLEVYDNNSLAAKLNKDGLELYGENDIKINQKSLLPVTLYENSSGTDETVILNNSAANYSYLEIFYTDNDNNGSLSVKIANPNGKYTDLSIIKQGETNKHTYIIRTKYLILGTSITPSTSNAGFVLIIDDAVSQTTNGTNYLKINRVIGWE